MITKTNNQLIVSGNVSGNVKEEAHSAGSVGLDVVPLIWASELSNKKQNTTKYTMDLGSSLQR